MPVPFKPPSRGTTFISPRLPPLDGTQTRSSSLRIFTQPNSIGFSQVPNSNTLRKIRSYTHTACSSRCMGTKNLIRGTLSHLVASLSPPWHPSDSETYYEQDLIPSVFKDISYVEFLGVQKHLFQVNHGAFVAWALSLNPPPNIGSFVFWKQFK